MDSCAGRRGGGLGDSRQMADEKKKAERHFNWQALKEAVERMKPNCVRLVKLLTSLAYVYSRENDSDARMAQC